MLTEGRCEVLCPIPSFHEIVAPQCTVMVLKAQTLLEQPHCQGTNRFISGFRQGYSDRMQNVGLESVMEGMRSYQKKIYEESHTGTHSPSPKIFIEPQID